MHGGKLAHVGRLHKEVEGLALVNEHTAVGGHVDDIAHGHFPNGFVEFLDVVGNAFNALDRSVVRHDGIFHVFIPKAQLHQIHQQVLVHYNKFARKHAARVQVARVRLEALVVTQDLRGGCRGHWSKQQGVPNTVLFHFLAKCFPIPTAAEIAVFFAPQIVLEFSL